MLRSTTERTQLTDRDSDLGKYLIAKLPWLIDKQFAWGWDCGIGWESITTDLLKAVEQECPGGKGFTILQVKEKLGTIRFMYKLDGAYEGAARRIRDAETLLDARSLHTCETCGKRGRLRNAGGYLFVACDEHSVVEKRTTKTYEPEPRYFFSDATDRWYDPEIDAFVQGAPPTPDGEALNG